MSLAGLSFRTRMTVAGLVPVHQVFVERFQHDHFVHFGGWLQLETRFDKLLLLLRIFLQAPVVANARK